jgi:phosphoribosylamine--glycine ligase
MTGIPAADASGAKVFHSGSGWSDGQIVTAGGRVLGITAGGETLGLALANAYQAAQMIHFEGMHFRSDIGRKGLLRTAPLD